MKKLPLAISLISLLLVAGCGSNEANEQEEPDKNSTEEVSEPAKESESETNPETENPGDENVENDETGNNDSTPGKEDDGQSSESKPSEVAKDEKLLTYQLNGETKKESAKLINSDNQDFSMFVLPEYELTGEEPRKDLLYVKESDSVSMRIEVLSENPDWAQFEENIPTELSDVNTTITNPSDPALQMENATIYEASNGEERVTIYLIKNEKMPIKLTIFTTEEEDYRGAFVEMAKTISKTK